MILKILAGPPVPRYLFLLLLANATSCNMQMKDSDLRPFSISEKHTSNRFIIECKLASKVWKNVLKFRGKKISG